MPETAFSSSVTALGVEAISRTPIFSSESPISGLPRVCSISMLWSAAMCRSDQVFMAAARLLSASMQGSKVMTLQDE